MYLYILKYSIVTYMLYTKLTQISIVRVTDPDQYAALEQQIREFGQIPDQLFTEPHPSKIIQVCIFILCIYNCTLRTIYHESFKTKHFIFRVVCETIQIKFYRTHINYIAVSGEKN